MVSAINHIPIECTDPDDRVDGWQVGYVACKAKEPVHKFKVWPLPNHPDFQPFPYREVKKVDVLA